MLNVGLSYPPMKMEGDISRCHNNDEYLHICQHIIQLAYRMLMVLPW